MFSHSQWFTLRGTYTIHYISTQSVPRCWPITQDCVKGITSYERDLITLLTAALLSKTNNNQTKLYKDYVPLFGDCSDCQRRQGITWVLAGGLSNMIFGNKWNENIRMKWVRFLYEEYNENSGNISYRKVCNSIKSHLADLNWDQ